MSWSRVPRAVAVGLATAVIASGVSSCGTGEPEMVTEDVYCTDAQGKVIDEKYCDDGYNGSGGGFIWIGGFGGGYPPGTYLDPSRRTSAPIPYNDQAARTKAGIPAGKIGAGGLGGKITRPSSKGGGFGGSSRVGTGSSGGGGKASGG